MPGHRGRGRGGGRGQGEGREGPCQRQVVRAAECWYTGEQLSFSVDIVIRTLNVNIWINETEGRFIKKITNRNLFFILY